MKVVIKDVRHAFPNLNEPGTIPGSKGKPAWSDRLIIPKKHPAVREIEAAIEAVAEEKWGDKAPGILAKLYKDGEVAFSKEEYANKDGEVYAGFENAYHLGCRSEKVQPTCVDRDRTKLLGDEIDRRLYSGCYVVAHVDFWAQDNEFGRGVRAVLTGIQFFRDGDSFGGGRPSSADEFEDYSDGVDDDDGDLD